jgi:hypothetical protein
MSKTQEEVWMEEAIDLIRERPALQFFMQNFFELTGLYNTTPTDGGEAQRVLGYRDAGLEVKGLLENYDPTLYHELQLSRINYLLETGGNEKE